MSRKKAPSRLLTDAVREVRNTRSRFLSLLVLSALAVCFLAGLRATAPDMKETGDLYFDQQRLMDLRVVSTLGLTEEDVELLARQGILCERKSVYSDIDALNALGYDIRLRRGRSGGYWMATRPFELAELKLLVDAVQSSRVISKASSDKLIHKLEGLASQYEGSQLQRQVYVDGRPKSANKDLPYSVDALFTAINTGRMVRFRYKKAGRPAPYTISPWQMAWENGCYYLIAYQDEKEPVGIRHYRVDKMAGVTVLDEPRRGKEQFADLDLPAYLKKHFQMFGGPEYRVTLRCTSDLESAMRERFGASPIFVSEGKEHFHFDVPVCVSDQFYGWVCGFGGKIEVVSPAEVRDGLRALSERLVKMHQ